MAVALLIGLAIAPAAPARAQPTDNLVSLPPVAPKKVDPANHSDQPPSPSETMRVFNAVEPWVRAWAVPGEDVAAAKTGADGRPLPAQWGVCINLRLHGQLIGRGVAMVAPDSASPDSALIARAAAMALREADARLPVPNDLMRAEAVRQLTPDIQISLELAGAAIPILADLWTLLETSLAPGLDGLVVRAAGDTRVEFPSSMMMANTIPQKSIRSLMATVIGEGGAAAVLDPPREIRTKHGVGAWRFRVSHLAQCAPGKGPEFHFRGARLRTGIPSQDDLRRFAGSLALHIIGRTEFGPAETRPLSMAMGAYALAHYDRWRRADRYPPQPWLPSGADAARRLHCEATAAAASTDDPLLAATLALGAVSPMREPCPGLAGTWSPDPVVRHALGLDERLSGQPLSARALLALAVVPLVPLGVTPSGENEATLKMAERGMRGIDGATLVSAMPWYGWGEIRLEQFRREIEAIERGLDRRSMFSSLDVQIPPRDLPAAVALRQTRSEVWKHQIDTLDAGDDGADMVGGIVFTSGNTSPLPTWQCVRPLAFLATMLGDERLTEPNERALELARLLHAFRFLRQLQVDDSCGWMYPNPEAAIGGMRAATWDHTMPPDATSLTLLAVVELLKSMDKIAPEMGKGAAK